MNQLRISQRQNRELLLLTLSGQLDALTADELLAIANSIKSSEVKYVVFDLEDVSLVDSSGIGAMVSVLKYTRSQKGDTVVANLINQPKEVFKILNLDKAFKTYDSADEAIDALGLSLVSTSLIA